MEFNSMNLEIDKSEWKEVKLGDVAFEYSIRINEPGKSGFDRFVGNPIFYYFELA